MTIRAGGTAMQAHVVPNFLAFTLCPVPGLIQTAGPLLSEQSGCPDGAAFARISLPPDSLNIHWWELTGCVLNRFVPLA